MCVFIARGFSHTWIAGARLDLACKSPHKRPVMEDFWVPLLIRMVVTAAVVLAATAAAEREPGPSGPADWRFSHVCRSGLCDARA